MEYTYFISYSCYTNEMSVLLNGKSVVSKNSGILQYMNEPFYNWCTRLPDSLYRELGENYDVVYMGRTEEMNILRKVFGDYPHCRTVTTRQYVLSKSVQERMIELSKIIRESSLNRLPGETIPVVFVGTKEASQRWKNYIGQLDVKNQYCSVVVRMEMNPSNVHDDEVVFYLDDGTQEKNIEMISYRHNYMFVLDENIDAGFAGADENRFRYGIDQKSFFDVIFGCLLLFPLAESFSTYAKNMERYVKDTQVKRKIQALLSVKPCIYISAEKQIEKGCSVPLNVQTEPEGAAIPGLVFEYQVPDIVECTYQRVLAHNPGKTRVLVYEKGTAEPVAELRFEVYERNRIASIDLSDYSLVVGVGDRFGMSCQYLPEDADNVDKLQWYSSDETVAEVSSTGFVTARAPGKCRIYCAAEKISQYCELEVKPYLQELELLFDEYQPVQLEVGEKWEIPYSLSPGNAIDGELIFTSSNLLVANLSENVITGDKAGEADIVVENAGGKFRKSFHVIVGGGEEPEPQPVKKKRLWLGFGRK